MEINSLQNPRVKGVVRLRKRAERDEHGLMLIEGYRELLRASEAQWSLKELFYCREFFLGENEDALMEACAALGAVLIGCSKAVFSKLSYRDRPDGLLAVASQQRLTLDALALSDNPLLLVAEGIEKPGNLGTMLRTCDAAGVDGLIVCDPVTDIFNPNVVRASVGTLFTVPCAVCSSEEALTWLKERGIVTGAATPHTDRHHFEEDLSGPLAIVIGAEQYGLSDLWLNGSSLQLKIPMAGRADSLNAALSGAILLYDAVRQRAMA